MARSDWLYGALPPKDDEGNYRNVLGGVGPLEISEDGTALTNVLDGTTYDLTAIGSGGTSDPKDRFSASGLVSSANAATLRAIEVQDGETYEIHEAGLLLADGQPAPTDLDLVIATMDNAGAATVQSVAISGDGTKQNDVSNSPIASYANTTGSKQTVAVMIDNGQFNAGTGSDQEAVAHFQEDLV